VALGPAAAGPAFITLEGPDGAGKTSQAAWLAARLREAGHVVCETREPGGTRLGEQIRELLLRGEAVTSARSDALLFNAARAEHVASLIRPALARGEIVVCDRFVDSTLAYQGGGGGQDLDELRRLNAFATGGLDPDLTILLDLPVTRALARRTRGPSVEQTRFEDASRHDLAFHERVRATFLAIAADEPARWRVVDADRAPDIVAASVAVAVATWLAERDVA
jgi:dTMP kinase